MPYDQQSPINLANPVVTVSAPGALSIHWGTGPLDGIVTKDSHGAKVVFPLDPSRYLSLDGHRFALRSFHFHHPSEHLLNGRQMPLELHIVHQDLSTCALAVLGVFFDLADTGHKKSKAFVEELGKKLAGIEPEAKGKDTIPPIIRVRPSDLLPSEGHAEYFRYEGSLTTEPFTETVSWVVLRHPVRRTQEELSGLVGAFHSEARGIQPLNRRFLLANFDPESAE
ncbi:carbonic anhydrase family protein [Gemmata sp. G18]|uniref:carbonic anhydrase n=1 Tax=Gemmata palustris TaxID=2822762 RepID=A0ABS5BVT5_9BACT|nr:carbonic anhydrase family protein [Gemmata palustris]MBP3957814.1 carbonic anhydrase family protein [Gemmata palustris]